jgi:hypothetical protein
VLYSNLDLDLNIFYLVKYKSSPYIKSSPARSTKDLYRVVLTFLVKKLVSIYLEGI